MLTTLNKETNPGLTTINIYMYMYMKTVPHRYQQSRQRVKRRWGLIMTKK